MAAYGSQAPSPPSPPMDGGAFHVAGCAGDVGGCFVKPGGGAGDAGTDPAGGPFTGGAFWGVLGAGGAG